MSMISIIIPFYNNSDKLVDCIQSIREQNIDEYEIILVRDYASEKIPEHICHSEDIRVFESEENKGNCKGPANARNTGIREAVGEYIYFIDADDYLMDGCLVNMLKLAEKENADLVTGTVIESYVSKRNFFNVTNRTRRECSTDGRMSEEELTEVFTGYTSATHCLLRTDKLKKEFAGFSERTEFFSDLTFLTGYLPRVKEHAWKCGDSVYVTTISNDPLRYPTLSQRMNEMSTYELEDVYYDLRDAKQLKDSVARRIVEAYIIEHIMQRYPDKINREQVPALAKMLKNFEYYREIEKKYSFLQRKRLHSIRGGHRRLADFYARIETIKNKKQGIIGNRIQWYRVIEHLIFNKMSIRKDWIIFESFFGKSYSDSPKYIYEFLQRTEGDKYRYIWVLNGKSAALAQTGKHKTCKMNSIRYVYYMARCGYRVFNVRQPAWNKKRPGVVFLETWHGTPLKKLAFDIGDIISASQNHKMVFYEHAREWNYLVSANRFSTDVFERAFVYDRDKILECGYPRNDILYAENRDEIAAEVKRELGIPEEKRVILYAPTWRDNQFYDKAKYKFTLAMDLSLMQKEFGESSVILLRTHYYIADILDLSAYEGFVYNCSQYEDVSRLYLLSDICITDYSSVFFDFANLKRPILFFVYDLEEYASEIRGMYMDMEKELPGPILQNNDELVEALKNMDTVSEKYRERYEEFYERFCSVDDGNASARIVERVFGERNSSGK